jgi:hypothetical protein
MPVSRAALLVPVLLLPLSGCGEYDPPVQADHASEHYKTDLEACRKSSSHAVYLKNADNPWSWMISPITGPPAVRAAMRTCMEGKHYVLAKTGG